MKKFIIRILLYISIFLGFYRVCCLEVLNSAEDYFKYRKLSVEDFRLKLNNEDAPFIKDIWRRAKPGEGVLVLHLETYFINYYAYPAKLYKFKKGYYGTSVKYDFRDVDRKWLDDRNVKWVLLCDENRKYFLKNISEMK